MTFFLIFLLSIYALAHAYFFHRVRAAYQPGRPATALLATLCSVLLLSAPLTRLLERDSPALAAQLALVAFSWMALLFLFFTISFALEVLLVLSRFFLHGRPLPPAFFAHRTRLLLPLLLSVLICGYGSFEARHIRVERLTLYSSKLASGTPPITIAMLSDVHLGLMTGPERLANMLQHLAGERYDLLVLTGDTIDGPLRDREKLAALFRAQAPPLGTFAITGNHEFYAGIEQCSDFFHLAGITLLRNRVIDAGPMLRLVGIDDPAVVRTGSGPPPSAAILCPPAPERFTLLLQHRPVVLPADFNVVDLQLSGHIHRGQIFPAVLLTRLFFQYPTGLTPLADEKWLYVSRGIGTWGPAIRFLAPPELTLITISPEN
ncbi:MAG: hypothetical protein BWK76_24700 [Desulfobulbaceae bacterium A2]|nr:MAG: hypothetical protein BWK76_24700 [Desulfobulbaceae bacterium A2]